MMPRPDEVGSAEAQLSDPADDVITVGGRGGGSPMATESEPNGWFAGPRADPDRFELLGPGLAGGEGNIWRARYRGELTEPLTLAVKELRRPPNAPAQWPTPADVSRWNDQRALLQYMRIDHLVTVIDIFVGTPPHGPGSAGGAPADTPYVVMEWVPGPTLADELSGHPATSSTLDGRLAHVQHVAEALHALHSRTASAGSPTLHRDVKPTNCILDPRRGIVLVDVGTMRRMDDGYDDEGFHTPAYTAPEVLANPRAARAASSDLYALGALAYFCVVGADPPVSDQPEAAEQIQIRLLAAARSAQVANLEEFVEYLRLILDPAPPQRPGDAMSWSRRLRVLAATQRPAPAGLRSRRVTVVAGSCAVVLALGAFGALYLAQDGPADSDRSDGTITSLFAAIVAPGPGSSAPRCTIIEGTSKLPGGQTLLTSVENLTVGDKVRHLQIVRGWDHPATLRTWEGRQFIGLPGEAAGGRFRIEVIMVPLVPLKEQITAGGGERGTWRARLPSGSKVVASIVVTRSAAENTADCAGDTGPPPIPPR